MTERAANKITDNKMIKKKTKTFKLLQFQHNKKKSLKKQTFGHFTLSVFIEKYILYMY